MVWHLRILRAVLRRPIADPFTLCPCTDRQEDCMRVGTVALPSGVIACAAVVAACSSGATDGMDGPIGVASSALGKHPQHVKVLFDDALSGTNGRSCATCHVPDKHFILHPADVAA